MKHKETEKICKYCEKPFKDTTGRAYMCSKCGDNIVLVRQLIAIGNKIKRGAKK